MKKLFSNYVNSFGGLSKEIWLLALITFINRAGTMVVPFLSIYLKDDLGFTYKDIGWIMMFFGAGSLLGTYLGGRFSDRIGFYPIMFSSLFTSGFIFIGLQYFQTFWTLCAGTFLLTLIADMFRPAIFVAIDTYSKPGNETRSVTLIRLAINLGFSIGPALGGFIIEILGYGSLFWVDGITCILGAVLILVLLDRRQAVKPDKAELKQPGKSPYRDKNYLLFFIAILLMSITFMQYFSTIPLYYKEVIHLSPKEIGWIFFLNGFLIAVFEMPLVAGLEKSGRSMISLINWGIFLIILSFLMLNIDDWIVFVVAGMLAVTLGEMISFPFSNAFALERAKNKNKGAYMALYAMSFSLAHILAPIIGMQTTENFGFDANWYIMALFLGTSIFILSGLKKSMAVPVKKTKALAIKE
ncbi:MFS transporter [Leptobacterium flavescens]|uniref:MFS transporter n=1 Tax=Leptobacterium flavescens TaxID=472055 RepID=A0A6P0USE1_9FLAO|nr:MFS transporter [Leptobacterium flavescens]NER15440.1 MFS transporter [Leptobacterium flavescens]